MINSEIYYCWGTQLCVAFWVSKVFYFGGDAMGWRIAGVACSWRGGGGDA